MQYFKSTFTVESAPVSDDLMQTIRDIIAGLAAEAGFESFEDTPDGIIGYVQEDHLDRHALDESMKEFPVSGVTVSYQIEEVENKDWNEAWEENGFDPIEIAGKCIIHDTIHPIDETTPHDIDIVIDARMAFGSGTHETTQMVVEQLLTTDLTSKRVLDCGCGTGILSIVASKAGASDIVAYDIDEWCVENTTHNAQLNGVDNITVLHGDIHVLSHVSGMFDVIVANINRNILLADITALREVMTRGGLLIISGFYEEDAPVLVTHASETGLTLLSTHQKGNWVTLVFTI